MLNKLRERLKDNNVSSPTQATLPEQSNSTSAARQAGSASGGELANSRHWQSRSRRACVSCLSLVKVAEAP